MVVFLKDHTAEMHRRERQRKGNGTFMFTSGLHNTPLDKWA